MTLRAAGLYAQPHCLHEQVTDTNKLEYILLLARYHLVSGVESQLRSLLQGIYAVIPANALSAFDYRELELLLCGLPDVDIYDWMTNTWYEVRHRSVATLCHLSSGKCRCNVQGEFRTARHEHKVVQWFWRFIEAAAPEQRAKVLQFTTGTHSTCCGSSETYR